MLDGFSKRGVRYHYNLDDPKKISAELIVAWATVEKFKLDIMMIQSYIDGRH